MIPGFHRFRSPGGFALITVLSLLVLLPVVSVGLLSLSAVSLRSGSHMDAANIARANARLALMLAIGDLQREFLIVHGDAERAGFHHLVDYRREEAP